MVSRSPSATAERFDDDISLKRLSSESVRSAHSDRSQLILDNAELIADSTSETNNLPPQDRGKGAWCFLLGIWLVEAALWGFPLAFGVFQSYYSTVPEFKNSSAIPTIGALSISISYLGLPLTNAFALTFRRWQRCMVCVGWFLCLFSLVLASFATKVWHLVLTQGLLYGVAWVICYTPFFIFINDWFNLRRGLAYGILFGASGVSGLILPFGLESACHTFGFRNTLRGYVVLAVVISGPGLLLIKARTPLQLQKAAKHALNEKSRSKYAFIKNPWLYPFALAVFLQGLGFFLPPTFLPSYSTDLKQSHAKGDLLLAINSLAQVTGQILLGHYSDKTHPYIPTTISTIAPGLAAVLLWGPSRTFIPLAIFSGIWGFFSGSYSVLWYRAVQHVTSSSDELYTVYGWMSFERGVSLLLAGPVSSGVLKDGIDLAQYGIWKYKDMVIFVGVTQLLSSATNIAYVFEKRQKASRIPTEA